MGVPVGDTDLIREVDCFGTVRYFDGYETAEVSAAKTLVGDILGTDFGGYATGDLDTLVAADRIINRLVAAGWRPTIEDDPYFVSESLLREIDRQRE